jgi:hypothetical protein
MPKTASMDHTIFAQRKPLVSEVPTGVLLAQYFLLKKEEEITAQSSLAWF